MEQLQQARTEIETGNNDGALPLLRRVLGYPHSEELVTEDVWQTGLAVLRDFIGQHADLGALQQVIPMAIADSNDVSVLYTLGYELIEVGLNRIAATALIRANQLAPGHEKIITELSTALEKVALHRDAMTFLEQARSNGVDGFFPTYLLGFNAFLAGDANRTREALSQLDPDVDEDFATLPKRLEGFLERHAVVSEVSSLDSNDLRGWNYAVSGSVVTHLSPYGFESMRGRYAMVQDSEAVLHEGIERLAIVLDTWQFTPTTVQFTLDRSSEIIARAIAQRLGTTLQPFSANPLPGRLIVSYDFRYVDESVLRALFERGPDEILFAHAMQFTDDYPFSPDVCTYQHQHNIAPWEGGRMRVDPDTQEVTRSEPNNAPAVALADTILSATPDQIEAGDRDALVALAKRVGKPVPGIRLPHYAGSPVHSSTFG